ncbi:MAG TPA: helix-turn-helix domain-containing protein [Puia sp.]
MGDIRDEGDLPENHEIFPLNITAISFLEKSGLLYYINQADCSLIMADPITFVGPMTYKGVTQFHKTGKMITIVFTAVGLFSFFALKMSDIVDTAGNGTEIINDSGLMHCREYYFNAENIESGIRQIENYFINQLDRKKIDIRNIDRVTEFINEKKGNVHMDWLLKQANMSTKTFERHFSEKIGLTPKLFSRIVRFSHSMKMLDQRKEVFDIIDSCGYVDQAHFIRSSKILPALHPGITIKD